MKLLRKHGVDINEQRLLYLLFLALAILLLTYWDGLTKETTIYGLILVVILSAIVTINRDTAKITMWIYLLCFVSLFVAVNIDLVMGGIWTLLLIGSALIVKYGGSRWKL